MSSICKKCSIEFNSTKGLINYCSLTCRNSRLPNNVTTKIVNCIKCNNEVKVGKHATPTKIVCFICKHDIHQKRIYKCNVCGDFHMKHKKVGACLKMQLIPTLIKYFGFNSVTLGTLNVHLEYERIKTILLNDYFDLNLSTLEIGKKYNINNSANVNKILKSLGIVCRTLSQSTSLAVTEGRLNGEHNKYHTGYHTTWSGEIIFYRSGYELEYALHLDANKVEYEVESLRIEYWDTQLNKYRISIPDFYLPETNTIVEIKSSWTYNQQNLKDRLIVYKKMGYDFKLILNKQEMCIDV